MFFGLFKKKPDKVKIAMEVIPPLIAIQFTLSNWDAKSVARDHWALGYIYGFQDGYLQVLKFKNMETLGTMAVIYHKIFGTQEIGMNIFRQSLDLQHDVHFRSGAAAGGNEAFLFAKNGTPPLGLSKRPIV